MLSHKLALDTQNILLLHGQVFELNNTVLTIRKFEPQVQEETVLVRRLSVSLAHHLDPGTITVLELE